MRGLRTAGCILLVLVAGIVGVRGQKLEPNPAITVLSRLRGHRGWVLRLRLGPHGRWLCSASADDTIRVWDLMHPGAALSLQGHRGSTFDCDFITPRAVISAGRDNTIRLWSRETGAMTVLAQHQGDAQTLRLAPGGQYLVSGGRDRKLLVLKRTPTGFRVLHRVPIFGAVIEIVWLAPDHFLTALENGRVIAWRLDRGLMAERVFLTREGGIRSMCYDPAHGYIFAGTTRGEVYRWRLAGAQDVRVWSAHRGWVTAMVYHPQAQTLITAGRDRMLRWWSTEGRMLGAAPTLFTVLALVALPPSQDLLLAGEDPDIYRVRWQWQEPDGQPGTSHREGGLGWTTN